MRRAKEAAVVMMTAATFGTIGGLVTHGIDSFDQTTDYLSVPGDYEDLIPEARAQVEREGEQIAVNNDHLNELKKSLGEVCAATIASYGPGNILYDASDESAANTIMLDPRQQCGTDSTAVRASIVDWRETASKLNIAKRDAEFNQGHLDRMEAEQRDDENFDLTSEVAIGGALFAGAITSGLFAAHRKNARKRAETAALVAAAEKEAAAHRPRPIIIEGWP